MTTYSFKSGRTMATVSCLAMLAGCAATPMGPTVQVMPGPGKSFETFASDQASCKVFAQGQVQGQADAANQRAVGAALLTTALGAASGALIGSAGGQAGAGAAIGAGTGATAGAAIGAGNSSSDQAGIQVQYDNAFSQCMYAKGDQVPGYAPQVAFAVGPVARAVPDPLVRSTQAELGRLGYLRSGADGFMGPRTRSAIINYEQSTGLPADGAPSPTLLARLQSTPTPSAVASAPPPSSGWVSPSSAPSAQPVSASGPASSSSSGWVTPQ